MAHQASGQLDFADAFVGNNQKLNQQLDQLGRCWWTGNLLKQSSIASTLLRPADRVILCCSFLKAFFSKLGTTFRITNQKRLLMTAFLSDDLLGLQRFKFQMRKSIRIFLRGTSRSNSPTLQVIPILENKSAFQLRESYRISTLTNSIVLSQYNIVCDRRNTLL